MVGFPGGTSGKESPAKAGDAGDADWSLGPEDPLKVKVKVSVAQPGLTLCDSIDCSPHQALLSMEFSRREYWSGPPCPSSGGLLNPGIKPGSLTLQADSLLSGNPLQYSCLENSMGREAWRAVVHGVIKSRTWRNTHPHQCEAVFHCGVNLHFPDAWCLTSFQVLIYIHVSFYWNICSNTLPLLFPNCFLLTEFCDFNKFWRQHFHHICDVQLLLLPACSLSHFLSNVFEEHKLSFLFFPSLMDHTFDVKSKKSLCNSRLQSFLPMFSSASFIVLGFTFRALIHFNFYIR